MNEIQILNFSCTLLPLKVVCIEIRTYVSEKKSPNKTTNPPNKYQQVFPHKKCLCAGTNKHNPIQLIINKVNHTITYINKNSVIKLSEQNDGDLRMHTGMIQPQHWSIKTIC